MPGVRHSDNSKRRVDIHTLHRHSVEIVLWRRVSFNLAKTSPKWSVSAVATNLWNKLPMNLATKALSRPILGASPMATTITVIDWNNLEEVSGDFSLGKNSGINI